MNSPIQCEALSKRFRRVLAVDNLQLEVPEDSIYALIGPNGAGKTTLMGLSPTTDLGGSSFTGLQADSEFAFIPRHTIAKFPIDTGCAQHPVSNYILPY